MIRQSIIIDISTLLTYAAMQHQTITLLVDSATCVVYNNAKLKFYQYFTCRPNCWKSLIFNLLLSPADGETYTLNGESGMCWSLNLIDTKYSPKINSHIIMLMIVMMIHIHANTQASHVSEKLYAYKVHVYMGILAYKIYIQVYKHT